MANSPKIQFPPITDVTSQAVGTRQAAYYMNREPQTLRTFACNGTGPIRPIRVNGRLAWPVADIQRVMSGSEGL